MYVYKHTNFILHCFLLCCMARCCGVHELQYVVNCGIAVLPYFAPHTVRGHIYFEKKIFIDFFIFFAIQVIFDLRLHIKNSFIYLYILFPIILYIFYNSKVLFLCTIYLYYILIKNVAIYNTIPSHISSRIKSWYFGLNFNIYKVSVCKMVRV